MTLSDQMLTVLRLLDREDLTAKQLNDRLFEATLPRSRRVFAASMSRTLRRLGQRGLVFYEGDVIGITQGGRFRLHPEQFEAYLDDITKSVRPAFEKDWPEVSRITEADADRPDHSSAAG